ncbi:hypothetical protein ACP3VW_09725 [Vibrio sp. DNB22_17_1]
MASIQIFHNEAVMPTGEKLPFKPFSRNFYALIAQCEHHTQQAASFVGHNVAIIPMESNRRLVVML